jgi:SAM-dependent methyltransferase
VDIDYIINEHGYADTLRDVEKFDYIVATHVIEHVPQLIAWFQDLSNILKPNGKLCLSIPDKRYTFDHYRYQTTFAECFDVYTRNIKNHPARVLDEVINATTKNTFTGWWANCNDMDALPKEAPLFRTAVDLYQKALADHNYMTPGHCSVFTPESFLFILYGMNKLSLSPFRCVEFFDTEENSTEFNGTYMRENTSKIQCDIIDMPANHIMFSTAVNTAGMKDNAFHTIDLPFVKVKKGAMYEFRFTSIDGTSGNTVTIYTTGKGKATDTRYGMINGERQDFNFSMKISGIK